MPADIELLRAHLHAYDFSGLLVEELGWNHYDARPVSVQVDGFDYVLEPAAEKAGFAVYICGPDQDGAVPPYPIRRKIEHQVAKVTFEHMIVFVDAEQTIQVWQWVKRENGKSATFREQDVRKGQRGDALLQRLQGLAFDLEEEEGLGIPMVALRVQQALDVEKVTKRFYERFKKELETFQGLIEGINTQSDREWYASLMLNRMMFIYFIQKQSFLDADQEYLRNRLRVVQEKHGQDRFDQFYRIFLLRLFHEGLGQPESERAADLVELLGTVPYLNGGLFDVHGLEQNNPDIQIPDEAFEKIFDFFDEYRWHLDERPHQANNEINPDVLGYIFEKYINQKEMGAYYTKEDLTDHITRNTVLPALFDAARKEYPVAFAPEGSIWVLLRDNPDRYIYPAVGHGVTWDVRKMPPQPLKRAYDLPAEIADGINEISRRGGWNLPATEDHGLPTETWREAVARRQRHEEISGKLASGKVQDINDLITLNLNISQFAEDVIVQSESPELVRAFWHTLNNVSILDPTCGSGAFLFAALNILEPLYNACLEGMRGFMDDTERSGESHPIEEFSDFRKILNETDDTHRHPNQRYFVLKSIILNNLYGVDIMQEAVEICKLRLFLKLMAQTGGYKQIEPLPDIDFNIRTGNTLVGFTSLDAVRQAMTMEITGQHRMLSAEDETTLTQIIGDAEVAEWAFEEFRENQRGIDTNVGDLTTAKGLLQDSLVRLQDQLDQYLAAQYGVDLNKPSEYAQWRLSHQPFHWFVEFYGIMSKDGFDVIVGNPPFVEYKKVDNYSVREFRTLECGNLYAFCYERSLQLIRFGGYCGLITPIGSISSGRTSSLRFLICRGFLHWVSSFSNRPAKLFDGVEQRISILFSNKLTSDQPSIYYSAGYHHWYSEERTELLSQLKYVQLQLPNTSGSVPKAGSPEHLSVLNKLQTVSSTLAKLLAPTSNNVVYYHDAPTYWIRAMLFDPNLTGIDRGSSHYQILKVRNDQAAQIVTCILNSSLFYLYFKTYSNCRDFTAREILSFPFPEIDMDTNRYLNTLCDRLTVGYKSNRERKSRKYPSGAIEYYEYYPGRLKSIIDEIDQMLAKIYQLAPEELDYVVNFEAKYRHA